MTRFQRIVSFFLAAGLVLGIAGVYVITRAIESIQLNYSGGYDYYGGFSPDYLAERVGEEVAKQGRLFASVKETLRAPDAQRFEVVLAVTAYPKEFTENTTAQLVMGDQIVQMTRNNGAFTGELAIPMEAGKTEYFIMLKDGNAFRSESIATSITQFASGWQVFGIYGSMGEYTFMSGGGPMDFHLNETLKLDESMLPFGDKQVSARVYAIQGEKELFSRPMQNVALELDHTVELKLGAPVELFGEVVGESGLTYRYSLYELVHHDDGVSGGYPGSGLLEIIGKDGQSLQAETSLDF